MPQSVQCSSSCSATSPTSIARNTVLSVRTAPAALLVLGQVRDSAASSRCCRAFCAPRRRRDQRRGCPRVKWPRKPTQPAPEDQRERIMLNTRRGSALRGRSLTTRVWEDGYSSRSAGRRRLPLPRRPRFPTCASAGPLHTARPSSRRRSDGARKSRCSWRLPLHRSAIAPTRAAARIAPIRGIDSKRGPSYSRRMPAESRQPELVIGLQANGWRESPIVWAHSAKRRTS